MIRVCIADDHEIVRSGLRKLIEDEGDIEICGELEDARGIVALAEQRRWDVLVMDVNMPGFPGPRIVKNLQQIAPSLAVVIFSMYPEDGHAISYLRSGARAFLNKRRSIKELAQAIRIAYKGGRYITPELADYLLRYDIDFNKAADKILSSRELQVVRQLSQGCRSKQIAAELGLSQSTVNTYVQRIKIKLGVDSVVEIAEFARENNLLS